MATPEKIDAPLPSMEAPAKPHRMQAAHQALAKKRAAIAIKRLLEEKARIDGLLGEGNVSGEGEKVIVTPPPPQEEVVIPPPPPPPAVPYYIKGVNLEAKERLDNNQLSHARDDIINENEEEKKMSSSEEIEAVPIENKPSKSRKVAVLKNNAARKKRKTPPTTSSNSSEDAPRPRRTEKEIRRKDDRLHKEQSPQGGDQTELVSPTTVSGSNQRPRSESKRDKKRRKLESVPVDEGGDYEDTIENKQMVDATPGVPGAMETIGNVVNRVRAIELPPAVRTAMRDSAATCGWGAVVFAMVLLRGYFEKKYGLRTGNPQQYQYQQPQQPPQQPQQRPNMAPVPDHFTRNNYPQPETKGHGGGGLLSR